MRSPLSVTIICTLLACCSLAIPSNLRAQDLGKPNIVFILTDDLGYGDISCYNPESKIQTPKIDKLATEGMKFTDAHSPSAVCTPTRYGFLTGRFAWRGVLKSGVIEGNFVPLLEENRETVASLLQKNGYHTAVFGKWHLGMTFQDGDGGPAPFSGKGWQEVDDIDFTRDILDGPNQHGFDEAIVSPGCPSDDIFNFWVENNKIPAELEVRGGVWQVGWDHEKVDTFLTYRAISFMEDHMETRPDDPFFLYLPLSVPHIPWEPPGFVQGETEAGPRGDQVFLADWCVAQVDSVLHELNITDNTILIFTSDNGPREGVNGHDSSGPLRGQKGEIWEGGHRIPLIVRWPGKIEANTRCDSLVGLIDFFSTCADMLDQDLPVGVAEDSYSILPYLSGEILKEPIREDLIHHSGAGVFSIRRGKWKLIVDTKEGGYLTGGPVPGTPGQLYDLEIDPYETNDLWEEMPELVSELQVLLELYIMQGYTRNMDDGTDSISPTAPTNLQVSNLNCRSGNLSWSPSVDSTGVALYEISGLGESRWVAGDTSCAIRDLEENMTYEITVQARDYAENISEGSTPLSFTTPECPDVALGFVMDFFFADGPASDVVSYEGVSITWDHYGDTANQFNVVDHSLEWIVSGRSAIELEFEAPLDLTIDAGFRYRYKDFWTPEWIILFWDDQGNVSEEILPIGMGILANHDPEWNQVPEEIIDLSNFAGGQVDMASITKFRIEKGAGPGTWYIDDILIGEGVTGLQSSDNSSLFDLFPNPASDWLQIFTDSYNGLDIKLVNMLGQPVYQEKMSSGTNRIDLSGFKPGIYLVIGRNEKQSITRKLIIK
jgi:arylsulfatase A